MPRCTNGRVALGCSCAENFCLKFMHAYYSYAYTWPGCYDGSLLVVKHQLALKELCDVMKISSTEHSIDNP